MTTGFLYDGPNIAQELEGMSNTGVVKSHLLTGGIDEIFLRLEGNDGTNSQSVVSDANNNTILLLDAAQNSAVRYAYEPYGMTTADGASGNKQQYTGRESDSAGNDEGFYNYRARYYMPGIARFISEDPIGWASGQTNNYAYAGGDPVSRRDPTGFDSTGPSGPDPNPQGPAKCAACLAACEAGGEEINEFCRSLPNRKVRAVCWTITLGSVTACKGYCYAKHCDNLAMR